VWRTGCVVVIAVSATVAACHGGSHANPAIDSLAASDASGDAPIDDALSGSDAAYGSAVPLQGTETYFKASNTGSGDHFGNSVGLSADGTTLVVGALLEQSNATGVDGTQTDNSAQDAGAAYVFATSGSGWAQQAYLKASNTEGAFRFGQAVAISSDGNTVAIGAPGERSCSSGINNSQADGGCGYSGAVYVFVRSGSTWSQQAYVKASNGSSTAGYGLYFGQALAISADGNTLAVGAPVESSNATGIDGSDTDTSAARAGAVYVFARSGTTWTQQAYVKASNTNGGDEFGYAVALTPSGDKMAVGAINEASAATGVNGSQLDNSVFEAGAVYLFSRTSSTWQQTAYIKASNPGHSYYFGCSVALSSDATTLAVGSIGEASDATGIDGNQTDTSQLQAGAVYVFANGASGWAQQAYVKEARSLNLDNFGQAVALSADGDTLVASAPNEPSAGTGLTTLQTPNQQFAGVIYTFHRSGTSWAQQYYIKSSNDQGNDFFGFSLSMLPDATAIASGGTGEASNATGVGGSQADNSLPFSGAVYIVR